MGIPRFLLIDVGNGDECPDQGANGDRTPAQLGGLAGSLGGDSWNLVPPNPSLYPIGNYTGSVTFGVICTTTINVYYEIDRDNEDSGNFLEILVNDVVDQTIDLNTLGPGSGQSGTTSITLTPDPCGNKITFNGSMHSNGGQDVYLLITLS